MFRQIDDTMFVSGQILPEDIAAAAAHGVALIINNRPDAEQPGQPASADIEVAAEAAGLSYRHIPVAGGLPSAQVDAMAEALASADGPVLAFCRSGTRSTYLWALTRAKAGDDADEIIGKAAAAGYDISGLRPHLT